MPGEHTLAAERLANAGRGGAGRRADGVRSLYSLKMCYKGLRETASFGWSPDRASIRRSAQRPATPGPGRGIGLVSVDRGPEPGPARLVANPRGDATPRWWYVVSLVWR